MNKDELRRELIRWALDVILVLRELPNSEEFRVLKYQLVKSSSSSAANYSASNRAKSKRDLINKRKIVEEELDESTIWLEMLLELAPAQTTEAIRALNQRAHRFLSIIVNSLKALRNDK